MGEDNKESINIKQVQEEVNYILFNQFNMGIKELKLSNDITKLLGDYVNGN